MKKISLLSLLFLLVTIGKTFAGSFTILNLIPCSFQVYTGTGTITDPATGTAYPFTFGPMTIAPGNSSFANPALLPGFSSSAPAGLQTAGCASAIAGRGPSGIDPTPVSANFALTNTVPYNVFTSTNAPTCNSGVNYQMSWNAGASGCDVILLIF
ncbi:hypothetical protein [Taibaiella chishuiensis]|uniref:hypothetical protein n=1 Tax=Taibaiella chishuiensis TaxID=1434707 RepID=UPI000D0CA39A|nr:hypothetical protein [Taibaiella chishuiensis]